MIEIFGNDITYAANLLIKNKLVAIPTETVYGIAANALEPLAVIKIFDIKKRPAFDPLIVHVPAISHFELYASNIDKLVYHLAEKFCPGPLTFILEKKNNIPDIVTSGLNTVGIRIPDHSLTLDLLNILQFPLAAPSANKFGKISPTNPYHIIKQFGNNIDYILDGGNTNVGIESTIIKIIDNQIFLLRHGGIAVEELEQFCHCRIKDLTQSQPHIEAPGQTASHYATDTPLIVISDINILNKLANRHIAFLGYNHYIELLPQSQQFILTPEGNLKEAATKLFSTLHEIDEQGYDLIVAEKFPEKGLGIAINDRLKRASAAFKI